MIITLCGSNRFEEWFKKWNLALSLAGHSVFSLAAYASDHSRKKDWYTAEQKMVLDQVHRNKIDVSDAVFVLNAFAYIGDSTMNEIVHAMDRNKRIIMLESWGQGIGIGPQHNDVTIGRAQMYGVYGKGSRIDTTSKSGFDNPWNNTDILGPAGDKRSELVKIVEAVS